LSLPAARAGLPAAIAALVCVHTCMTATRVAASLHLLQQGEPAWMVGALLAAFAVGPIVLALWAGQQADRHGMHRTLAVGAVLGSLGAFAAVVSQHPAVLMGAALATGGAISVAAIGIQREAGRMARDAHDLKRVFSWVALGPALSNSIAPVVVGLLIDHVGFRSAFAFAAALPLAAWWGGRRIPRTATAAGPAAGAPAPRAAFELLRDLDFRCLLMVTIVMAACWDAHSFVVPVLGHARGLSASSIGIVLGAFALAVLAVRIAISRWAERLDESRALPRSIVLAAAVCVIYGLLPGTAGMAAGSALLGLALGAVQPIVMARLHQMVAPERHGQALGVRMLATNVATLGVPLAFGLMAGVAGALSPLWLMAALMLLARRPARLLGG
jgi:MFS family permease